MANIGCLSFVCYRMSVGELANNPRSRPLMASRTFFLPPTKRAHAVRIAYLFAMSLLLPLAAHAQSPFDTGFTALQTLFTGTVAKVASLIAIVIGGYGFCTWRTGSKKGSCGRRRWHGHRCSRCQRPYLVVGRVADSTWVLVPKFTPIDNRGAYGRFATAASPFQPRF
jgi:hypothetical protein